MKLSRFCCLLSCSLVIGCASNTKEGEDETELQLEASAANETLSQDTWSTEFRPGIARAELVTQGPEVGKDGGKVDRLFFAVLGDSRPSLPNNTAGYPTETLTDIFAGIQAMNPRPQFVVGTGDYVFSTSGSVASDNQFNLFLQAAGQFEGVMFASMGNHECKMSTATNCAGATSNRTYNNFLKKLVQPLGKSQPYYTIRVDANDGSWTSKFVVVACNAWDSAQSAWFASEMAQPTRFTFVVRHQPTSATRGPCNSDTQRTMARYPPTMLLAGHEHTFDHPNAREIVVGTGGAPLDDDVPYGWATVEQLANGFRVVQYDSSTRMPIRTVMVGL